MVLEKWVKYQIVVNGDDLIWCLFTYTAAIFSVEFTMLSSNGLSTNILIYENAYELFYKLSFQHIHIFFFYENFFFVCCMWAFFKFLFYSYFALFMFSTSFKQPNVEDKIKSLQHHGWHLTFHCHIIFDFNSKHLMDQPFRLCDLCSNSEKKGRHSKFWKWLVNKFQQLRILLRKNPKLLIFFSIYKI